MVNLINFFAEYTINTNTIAFFARQATTTTQCRFHRLRCRSKIMDSHVNRTNQIESTFDCCWTSGWDAPTTTVKSECLQRLIRL